jgi:hypothetical protein
MKLMQYILQSCRKNSHGLGKTLTSSRLSQDLKINTFNHIPLGETLISFHGIPFSASSLLKEQL